jgi:hypothetical protein
MIARVTWDDPAGPGNNVITFEDDLTFTCSGPFDPTSRVASSLAREMAGAYSDRPDDPERTHWGAARLRAIADRVGGTFEDWRT